MHRLPVALVFLLFSPPAAACTTVAYHAPDRRLLVAKALDWRFVHGFASLNPRGAVKTALLLPGSGAPPLSWVAKHGSVSFNQVSRDFPFGGMNEKGLMIEVMWLSESRHPPLRTGMPAINESQYMQYLLDQAGSLGELLQLAEKVQVQKGAAPVHYLSCERGGSCAVIEFVGGERKVYSGARLPHRVLTNNNYLASLRFLGEHVGFGGSRPLPDGEGSLPRFVRAASEAQRHTETPAFPERGMALLEKVRTATTQWQIVYDPERLALAFRTRDSTGVKTLELGALDFSCSRSYRFAPLARAEGPLAPGAWQPYRPEIGEQHVARSGFLPEEVKRLLLRHERERKIECR